MNKTILLIPVMALAILPACKTAKTVAKQPSAVVAPSPVAQTIEQVQKNQPQFRTANVSKMTLDLNMNGREVSVSASCRIKKDTAIFVSVQPVFGIEMYRAELKPDSVKVIDKFNRRYYVADYSYLSERFGVDVDFYSLQSLLTAQLFCVGKRQIQPDSCKLSPVAEGKSLIFESTAMTQDTRLSGLNVIQHVLLKAKNSNYSLQTTYTGYTNINNINFPQRIALVASNEQTKATCDFSILRVEFNTELKLNATPTDRYTRGDIEQMLRK